MFCASRLFRRHVVGRADDEAGRGHAGAGQPGHAEIEDLEDAVGAHEDIARLDVAVIDRRVVRGAEPGAQLDS